MSVDSAISRFRRRERKGWRCVGKLTRSSADAPVFNEGTGNETRGEPSLIYEGLCQVRATDAAGRNDVQAGEREVHLSTLTLKLPHDVVPRIDDLFQVLESSHDPALVAKTFRIAEVVKDGWQVARVSRLEEVTP